MSIVVEVQVQSPDLFRAVSGETVGGQKVRDLIFRKRKDNLESQWSAFTADDLEAEVSGFIPAGVGFFRFFIKEVFLEKATDGKFVEGRDLAFYERKVVESVP